jgi:tetratricopeptide (TPR) repeat protein
MRYIFLTLLIAGFAVADPSSQFDEGLRLYREGDWVNAIEVWEDLKASGYQSGELNYNLGNAYFRNGDVGKAVVHYERALRMLPRDQDIKHNIEIAQLAVVDRIETPVRLSVWRWIDNLRDALTLRELIRIFQILGFVLVIAIGLFLYGPIGFRNKLRTATYVLAAVYLLIGGWYGWRARLDSRPQAVVMAEEAETYSGPDDTTTRLFTLHEGTIVRSREQLSDWVRIRLADGREGWLKATEIEQI